MKYFVSEILKKFIKIFIASLSLMIAFFVCLILNINIYTIFEIMCLFLLLYALIQWILYRNKQGKNNIEKVKNLSITILFLCLAFYKFGADADLLIFKVVAYLFLWILIYSFITTCFSWIFTKESKQEIMFKNPRKVISGDSIELRLSTDESYLKRADGRQRVYYRIYLKDKNRCVGDIDLRIPCEDKVYLYYGHIGYEIKKKYRGHHYAREATKLLLEYTKKLNLKEIIITCDRGNLASLATLKALKWSKKEEKKIPFIYCFNKNRKIYSFTFNNAEN